MTTQPIAPRGGPVPLRIQRAADMQAAKITCCYQGQPFTGKTRNAVSWPAPLVLSTDPNQAMPATTPKEAGIIIVESWSHFEQTLLPRIMESAPEFEGYETIVLDSLTYLGKMKEDQLGIKGVGSEGDKYVQYKVGLANSVLRLLGVARRTDLRRNFNVVVTVHETERTERNGAVKDITPSVVGSLKDQIAGWFDCYFLTQIRSGATRIEGNPPKAIVEAPSYFIATRPIDNFRMYVGDRLGGGARFPGKLPLEAPGDYPSLAKLWGIA